MTTASLAIARQRVAKQVKSRVLSMRPLALHWKWIYIPAILVSCAMLITYVAMVNQLTQGAYAVKNYTKEISQLASENKTLETGFAESGFLQDVRFRAQELNFQKITRVQYIEIGKNALAKAR